MSGFYSVDRTQDTPENRAIKIVCRYDFVKGGDYRGAYAASMVPKEGVRRMASELGLEDYWLGLGSYDLV